MDKYEALHLDWDRAYAWAQRELYDPNIEQLEVRAGEIMAEARYVRWRRFVGLKQVWLWVLAALKGESDV